MIPSTLSGNRLLTCLFMDLFHIYLDTNYLHDTPFGHPNFVRMLRRVQQGFAKLYLPLIALEERRTQLLDEFDQHVAAAASKVNELKKGQLGMLLEGLPKPELIVPTREEADRESVIALGRYLAEHKIEVLPHTGEHAEKAWARYFSTQPPFNPREKRENRRKDLPDAWILEAVLANTNKPGRHCVVTKDKRLAGTLEQAGVEGWEDIEKLDAEIGVQNAVVPIRGAASAPSVPAVPLDQLRSKEFENLDRILLGVIETWKTPGKETLLSRLETLGIRRGVAEIEAKTLELSGALTDTGSHWIPTNRETAKLASLDPVVQDLLLKALDHGF